MKPTEEPVRRMLFEQRRERWVAHHLGENMPRATRQAALQVWSCHGGLLRNGRAGKPLVIAGQKYQRGLLAHAPSDTCASGGRRNDLETLRRSVPLLRSDCFTPAEIQQAHTMGIALWMPYFGSGMAPGDVYWYRSCIFPASRIGMDTRRKDQDYALLKRMMAEYRQVEKFLLGDFYPLTSHHLDLDVWVGWQFDRPEWGAGIVQAFRRDESPYETARFRLRGLDPESMYQLQDFDQTLPLKARGRDLIDTGLLVNLPQRRSSCIIRYERVKP